jgi:hypothetical protein
MYRLGGRRTLEKAGQRAPVTNTRSRCERAAKKRTQILPSTYDGKDQRRFQVERGGCAHGFDLKGRQVGEVGDALQELAEGELLDGDQIDFKDDAQIGAQGVGEVAREAFVEIGDGAHLVLLDLSGLLEIAALEGRCKRRLSLAASQRGAKHGIDLFLIQHLFHVPSSAVRTA